MRRTIAILFALLLLSSLAVVSAQGQQPPTTPGGGAGAGGGAGQNASAERGAGERGAADREAHAAAAREWENVSAEARERGLARAEEARLFARFTFADGEAQGRFVSFGLDETTGALSDYAVLANGTSLLYFTTITPTPFAANVSARVTGAALRLDGGAASFAAHNNPVALMTYRAGGENLTVSFAMPSDVTVVPETNRTAMLTLGGAHAHLVVTGNGTLDAANGTATATLSDDGAVLFLAHPQGPTLATTNLHALRDAAAQGNVGAIVSVVNADGEGVADAVYLGVATRVRNVSEGRAEVVVSAQEPEGKAVVINLDATVLNLTEGQRLDVRLDGRSIAAAANATAVFAAQPGAAATYALANASANGTAGAQVVVHVPSFSEHVITIEATDETATDGTTTDGDGTTGTDTTTTSPSPTDTGGEPVGHENDAPAPAVALVALAALGAALATRRGRRDR